MNPFFFVNLAKLLLFTSVLLSTNNNVKVKAASSYRYQNRDYEYSYKYKYGKGKGATKSPTGSLTKPPSPSPITLSSLAPKSLTNSPSKSPTKLSKTPSISLDSSQSPTASHGGNKDLVDLPGFVLTITLSNGDRLRSRQRYLQNGDDYTTELLDKVQSYLSDDSAIELSSIQIESSSISPSKGDDGGSVIEAIFSGEAVVRDEAVPKLGNLILNSFDDDNKQKFISAAKQSSYAPFQSIVDVEVALIESVDGDEDGDNDNDKSTDNKDDEGETTLNTKGSNTGMVTGMLVGVFMLSFAFSYIYHRKKKKTSRSNKVDYELSDYYNNNDDQDEDANPKYCISTDSPHEIGLWGRMASKNSLGDLAAASAQNNDREYSRGFLSTAWNGTKTSMSKLAAGATQEEFVQNGMNIDVYGQSAKKKKKKGSPVVKAKKGSELDTTLDPIVEVSSSVASSIPYQTDDKMVKGDTRIPQLLPALSVSSCPSDEANLQANTYFPIGTPQLSSLSPDTITDEIMMSPYCTSLHSPSYKKSEHSAGSSDGERSPVRQIDFSDRESDKSSDSGLRELLDIESRVVMTEDEAVKASLIAFVEDEKENIPNQSDNHKQMLNELGSAPEDEKFNHFQKTGSANKDDVIRGVLGSAPEDEVVNQGEIDKSDTDLFIRTLGSAPDQLKLNSNSSAQIVDGDEYNATLLVLSAPKEETRK